MIVAIDGPAGAGKSTVARALAHGSASAISTPGAMYRALTWLAMRKSIALSDADALAGLARSEPVTFDEDGRVWIAANDVTSSIREPRDRQDGPGRRAPSCGARGDARAAASARAGGRCRDRGPRHRHGRRARCRGEGVSRGRPRRACAQADGGAARHRRRRARHRPARARRERRGADAPGRGREARSTRRICGSRTWSSGSRRWSASALEPLTEDLSVSRVDVAWAIGKPVMGIPTALVTRLRVYGRDRVPRPAAW